MVGRLDDYLREIADDAEANVRPTDIQQAGIAVARRSARIIQEREYDVGLIIAALRGTYHMTELAGGELIMSIFPSWQRPLMSSELPHEPRFERKVPGDVIDRLMQLPDFACAYEPHGMTPAEFLSYGVTQRTLAQFIESGWKPMETMKP
jgi:transaldolase